MVSTASLWFVYIELCVSPIMYKKHNTNSSFCVRSVILVTDLTLSCRFHVSIFASALPCFSRFLSILASVRFLIGRCEHYLMPISAVRKKYIIP